MESGTGLFLPEEGWTSPNPVPPSGRNEDPRPERSSGRDFSGILWAELTEGTKGAFSMGSVMSVQPAGKTPLPGDSRGGIAEMRCYARNTARRIYRDAGKIARVTQDPTPRPKGSCPNDGPPARGLHTLSPCLTIPGFAHTFWQITGWRSCEARRIEETCALPMGVQVRGSCRADQPARSRLR